jgi:hypothetical protein
VRYAHGVHVLQQKETARREFRDESGERLAVSGRNIEDVDVQVKAPC